MNRRNILTDGQVQAAYLLDNAEDLITDLRTALADAEHIADFAKLAMNFGYWTDDLNRANAAYKSLATALSLAQAHARHASVRLIEMS